MRSFFLKVTTIVGYAVALLATGYAQAADEPAAAAKASPADGAVVRPGAEPRLSKAEAEEELHHLGAPEKVEGPEEFQTDLSIYTFFVFCILLLILGKFAWAPIVAGLEKREKGVANNIAAAQRASDEAKTLLAQYDRRLAGAADEVRVMLDDARKAAEQTKADIVAEAKEAAKLEADRGKREISMAKDQAIKELSERTADLAVNLASKIVRGQLNQQDHARLAQEAMAQFVDVGASKN